MKNNQPIEKIVQENKKLFAYSDINQHQIDQLYYFAQNDSLVIRNTSDPVRFKDRSSFNLWQERKTIYTLSDEKESYLGGIIWLENKKIPSRSNLYEQDYPITIAIRIYGQLRGKGFALRFTIAALKHFLGQKKNSTVKGIWLQTSFNNAPLKKTFGKLGFEKIGESDEKGKILMVARVENIKKSLL